ncbi:MAG TPA: hypothetical protein VIK60_15260 [Vicinamibacterales bacterium]
MALSLLLGGKEAVVKRRTIAWFIVPVLLITAGNVTGDAKDVVEIMLHGHYFTEPATVRFVVAVEPDADNRTLRIEADSSNMFRASEVSLKGADEKRLHTFTFKNLSAGDYTLRAQVLSSHDVRGTAMNEMVVTGMGLR